jgi:hypothetical protein
MLQLLIDTSTWLDIAKRRDGQKWIVPLRVLKFEGKLELLIPSIVITEFSLNRPRAEASVTASVEERFKQLRSDVNEYGEFEHIELLQDMARQIPLVSSGVLQNFTEISELLQSGLRLEATSVETERVTKRGIENRAPFRSNKNSTADALIIELYASVVEQRCGDTNCFVTSNYLDFSELNGDRRQPHADLADLFAEEGSSYHYGVEGLNEALETNLGDEFTELSNEVTFMNEEPRTLTEILEAELEFFDKIWYVRHLIRNQKILAGESDPLPADIQERADEAVRVIRERYGADNVGPWDDWGWGFINGKLSALRWVIGSEWDFLDS